MDESNVERNLGRVLAKLEDIQRRMDHADDSRASIHDGMNALVLRVSHIEIDMNAVKHKVESVEEITEDVRSMRDQAAGAGTAGRWLIKVGIAVIGTAGWLAAAYTWMTGRPPP